MRLSKIKQNPNIKVHHKLEIKNIKQSSDVSIEPFILKVKRHERKVTFILVTFFLSIFVCCGFIASIPIREQFNSNQYKVGKLVIDYVNDENGLGDIITLTDEDILDDSRVGEEQTYNFRIRNNSNRKIKYKVVIKEDKSVIKYDECGDRLFDKEKIKYSINKGNISYLSNKIYNNEYVLLEETIAGKSINNYSLNVWLDKSTLASNRHFHGIIEVVLIGI